MPIDLTIDPPTERTIGLAVQHEDIPHYHRSNHAHIGLHSVFVSHYSLLFHLGQKVEFAYSRILAIGPIRLRSSSTIAPYKFLFTVYCKHSILNFRIRGTQ